MGTEGNYKDRIIGQNEIIIDNEAKDNEECLEGSKSFGGSRDSREGSAEVEGTLGLSDR